MGPLDDSYISWARNSWDMLNMLKWIECTDCGYECNYICSNIYMLYASISTPQI